MFEIAKRIAVEQDKNGNHFCIAHPSLSIASFRGGEGFESESAFLFNSNSYSLQKSSAIQQISVKQSSFWDFVETILRQKQVLLIPNWGYYTNFIAFMEDSQKDECAIGAERAASPPSEPPLFD